jgi:copper transport protein
VVARPERVIDPTSQLLAIGLPALAIVAVGFSRVEGTFALGGVLLSVLHTAAGAVWFGGALMVARVVVAGPGDEDLVHAVRGFNRISPAAIVITVATGVLQMFRLVGGGLFSTGHGRVLLLKTLAVAAMVFISMVARQLVVERLRRTDELNVASADRFRRAFGIEAGIGVVVLALSGWLLALNPAQISDRPEYNIERRFSDSVSGLDVTVFINPAEVGLNGLRIEVEAPQENITDLAVTLLPPEDIAATGYVQPIPLDGAGTAVLDEADGLLLEVPGQWTLQLTGSTPDGTLTGATTSFPVSGEAIIDIVPAVPLEELENESDNESDAPVVTVEVGEE